MTRTVTELDFRMPEYRDAKVEDYEFRADGKLVRKDRWERGIQSIRSIVGICSREFEIDEVVDAVRELVGDRDRWIEFRASSDSEDWPERGVRVDVRLDDGSVLINVLVERTSSLGVESVNWIWSGVTVSRSVCAWRDCIEAPKD